MVSFAAANTNPSSISAAKQVSVPTLLFSGVNDCVAPPAQHQDIIYDSTAATYKTQVYVTGGGHCYFANSNFACSFGESTCTPKPTISQNEQQATTQNLLKLWLAYYLKNDCPKAMEFQDSLSVSTRISYRQSQFIACVSGTTDAYFSPDAIKVYPNPFSGGLTLEMHPGQIQRLELYNGMMQIVGTYLFDAIDQNVTLDCSALPNGIYFIKINNQYWKKVLKSGFGL
jgi:hypothetical protein